MQLVPQTDWTYCVVGSIGQGGITLGAGDDGLRWFMFVRWPWVYPILFAGKEYHFLFRDYRESPIPYDHIAITTEPT